MTTQQYPAQFDWATELLDAQGRVTLSAQEAKEIGARLRSMGEKLKAYEDLDEAASDVQLLRTGYAAARLEIESLQARIKTMAEEHADEPMVAHLDGRMRAAQPAPQQEAQEPYSIDADPQGIRALVADVITGALAFGAQGTNAPPDGHWLAPFWAAARAESEGAPQPSPASQGDALAARAAQDGGDVAMTTTQGAHAQPEALRGAPPSAYSQEDRAFYTFWYGHMLNEWMQPPLAGVSHSTARYIWDAAIAHVAAPAQAADSVLEDAARWKMAVLVCNEVMLHPDKRSNPSAVKAYMDAVHSGLDLTGAVDAARKQGAKHD